MSWCCCVASRSRSASASDSGCASIIPFSHAPDNFHQRQRRDSSQDLRRRPAFLIFSISPKMTIICTRILTDSSRSIRWEVATRSMMRIRVLISVNALQTASNSSCTVVAAWEPISVSAEGRGAKCHPTDLDHPSDHQEDHLAGGKHLQQSPTRQYVAPLGSNGRPTSESESPTGSQSCSMMATTGRRQLRSHCGPSLRNFSNFDRWLSI